MCDVFISYASADADIARAIEKRLERGGKTEVWTENDLEVGDDWRERLRQALRSAKTYLFVLTPSFGRSAFAEYEIGFADAQKDQHPEKRLISVIARGGKLADAPAPLSSLVSIDAGKVNEPDKIAELVEETIGRA